MQFLSRTLVKILLLEKEYKVTLIEKFQTESQNFMESQRKVLIQMQMSAIFDLANSLMITRE